MVKFFIDAGHGGTDPGAGTGYEDFIHHNSNGVNIVHQNVIHEEIIKQIDLYNRGKKRANFHVLRASNMPSLLTESGFIDNAQDTAKLKRSEYIDRIVLGHVNGLVNAFGLRRKENLNEKILQQEKKVEKLFESNNQTLRRAVEYVLYRMEIEGELTATWRQKLLAGTLTESEAIGLLYVAVERGFIHNKLSNKQ